MSQCVYVDGFIVYLKVYVDAMKAELQYCT